MCSLSMGNYVGVVPPYYSGILNSLNARQDVFESSVLYNHCYDEELSTANAQIYV